MSRKLAEGRFSLCVRMVSLHRFVLFRSQCQEQTLWKERSKVKWWENIGKYLKTGRNGEGGRERQMARGRLVLSWSSACRHAEVNFHCHFYSLSLVVFTLSLVVFTLLLSFHLSLAFNHFSLFISHPFVLFTISDTICFLSNILILLLSDFITDLAYAI